MRNKLLVGVIVTFLMIGMAVVSFVALTQSQEVQSFRTEDQSFSFDYPEGWSVEVINPDYGPNAHLSVDNLPLEERFQSPEAVNIQISLPKKYYNFMFTTGETPTEMLAGIIAQTPQLQLPELAFGTPSSDGTPQPLQLESNTPDIQEFSVNGRPAAYAYNVMQTMGLDASQFIVIVDLGDDYWVTLSASAFEGGLETIQVYEPVILQIAQSMRHEPPSPVYSDNPDLPQVYSGDVGIWRRGEIQFFYPEDWYASYSMLMVFSNKQGNLINTTPESGQFIAVVNGVAETISGAEHMSIYNHCEPQNREWTARELMTQTLANISPAEMEQLETLNITLTQPEVITVNDVEMVYMRQYQDDFEVLSVFVDLGESNIPSMMVTTKSGEMAQFEEQLFAVASTFEYTPNPCDESNSAEQE